MFLDEKCHSLIQFFQEFIVKDPTDDKPSLVQIMIGWQEGIKLLSEPLMIYVTETYPWLSARLQ